MLPLRALGHSHSFNALRRPLTNTRPLLARHVAPSTAPRRLPLTPLPSLSRRTFSSTHRRPDILSSALASLDDPLIYTGGARRTLTIGLLRTGTIVFFVISLLYAPTFYTSPDSSNWWIPVFVIGGAVPFFAMAVASAPYVCSIKFMVPPGQRKVTQEMLQKWAERVPPNTALRVQTMRFVPWPVHRTVWFDDLRRLPPSFTRLANLEHVPRGLEGKHKEAGKFLGGPTIARLMGLLWVDLTKMKDRNGVWEKMWEQIPMKGQERKKTTTRTIAGPSVGLANRTAVTTKDTQAGKMAKKNAVPRSSLQKREKAARQRTRT